MSEEWSLGGLSEEIDLALCRWSVLHAINEIKAYDMSEMVERVAQAAYLHLNDGDWSNFDGSGLLDGAGLTAEGYRRLARDIIAAMREPTMAMVMAGKEVPTDDHEEEMWKAMIDTALSEEAKP